MLKRTLNRVRLLFVKEKKPYLLFEEILGFYPRNIEYYQTALLHKSNSVRTKDGRKVNNERLEFLGDSVLQTVVSDILYNNYPDQGEGFLTNIRSRIVKRESLNRLAYKIGLDKLIKFSDNINPFFTSIPGDAFEALIGAIYLDQGYQICYQFIEKKIINQHFKLNELVDADTDYKSKLIEWSQRHHFKIAFEVTDESPDNKGFPLFMTQVLINGNTILGNGSGASKKKSHQIAAKESLRIIRSNRSIVDELKRKCSQTSSQNTKSEGEEMLKTSEMEN